MVASVIWDAATRTVGKNYRGEVWTNWYRKPISKGILTLAHMRDTLNRDNLRSTYPPGVKTGFAPADLPRPNGVTHFRTADGSWNRLDNPKEGAAGTRFPRNVANSSIRRPTDEELLAPNPRTISRKLLTRGETMKEVPFLNLLAASWIQFQTHDWVNHGEMLHARRDRAPARRRRPRAHAVPPEEHASSAEPRPIPPVASTANRRR